MNSFPFTLFRDKLFLILTIILVTFNGLVAKKTYHPQPGDPFMEMWRWSSYPKMNGKTVWSTTQGKDGKIWFNARDGLYSYDGLNWQYYNSDNSIFSITGPSSLSELYSTEDGTVYIGDEKGICKFDGEEWIRIFPADTSLKWEIHWISGTSDQSLWAGLDIGALRLKGDSYKLYTSQEIHDSLANKIKFLDFVTFPQSLDITAREFFSVRIFQTYDDLWLDLYWENGDSTRFLQWENFLQTDEQDPNSWEIINSDDGIEPSFNMLVREGYDGDVWLGSYIQQESLYKYNIHTDQFSRVDLDRFDVDYRNYSIKRGQDGTMWFGDWGKIIRYKAGKWKVYTHNELPIPNTDIVIELLQTGDLWILGRNEGPHYKIDFGNDHWKSYNGLNFQCDVGQGQKWFLTPEGNAVLQNNDQWVQYNTSDGLISTPTAIKATRSGKIWAVGSHNGVAATAYLKNDKWIKQVHEGFSWEISYLGFEELLDGRMLFSAGTETDGYKQGLLTYTESDTGGKWQHYNKSEIPNFVYYALEQTSDSTIWIGGNSLKYIAQGKLSNPAQSANAGNVWVSYLYTDYKGELWVSHHGKGLFRRVDNSWKQYTVDDNLAANAISSIVSIEEKGCIYASTKNGISAFDGKSWTKNLLGQNFQVPIEGGHLNRDLAGNLWISLASRDWYFQGLNGRDFTTENFPRFKTICYKGDSLNPETEITFGLTEIGSQGNTNITWTGEDQWNMTEATDLEYSYRLNGGEWSEFQPLQRKQFLDMASGKYLFEVRARDTDFNVDPTPATLSFVVHAPFYKKPWFIVLMGIMLGAIVFQTIRLLLRDKELRNLSVVASETDNAVAITDPKGNIEWINAGFTRLYGWNYDEIQKKYDGNIINFSSRDDLDELIENCIGQKDFVRYEAPKITKSGKKVWAHRTITPILADGSIQKLITVDSDITELVKARKEAQKANRAKSEFVASVSHEIRTPMNSILGFSELLIDEENNPDKLENLYSIQQAGAALLDLINEILDISKIESNKLELNPASFNLHKLLDNMENMFQTRAAKEGLSFSLFVSESLPEYFIGDEKRVRQIMINIIGNAIKYTPEGKVTIHCYRDDGELVFVVEDTGVGIPPDQTDNLFKPFQKIENQATSNITGSGLGLAITMKLIKLMKGTIDLESEVNQGSTFTVKLPLEVDKTATTENNKRALEERLQVGIVDDSKEYIKIMKKMIEQRRASLIELPNEEKIVDQLEEYKIKDIIVIDYYMPGINGHDLNKILKKSTLSADIPTILCTATERAKNAIYHGFDDYVEKPVTQNEIWEKLDSTIAKAAESKIISIVGSQKISDEFIEKLFNNNYKIFYYTEVDELIQDIAEGLQTDLSIIELLEDEEKVVKKIENCRRCSQLPFVFLLNGQKDAELIDKVQANSAAIFQLYNGINEELYEFINNFLGRNEVPNRELVENWIEEFLAATGDDPDFREMILEYLAEIIEQINEVERDLNAGELEAIENSSHKLKGNAGNYQLVDMAEYAAEICAIAREEELQSIPMGRLMPLYIKLKGLYYGLPTEYTSGESYEGPAITESKNQILVADDAKMNRKLMGKYLHKFDLECDFAINGEDTLGKLCNKDYKLLFLDIKMPVLDGMGVLQRLANGECKNGLKIVALTANVMKGDQEKYLQAGCDDYLSKPLQIEDLKKVLLDYEILN